MIEGRCRKMVYDRTTFNSRFQCSLAAVVDGKWCKQHDPGAVKEREQQDQRDREQAKVIQDRMFEPVEGWVWCCVVGLPHRGDIGCPNDHRKLWVERTGGSSD